MTVHRSALTARAPLAVGVVGLALLLAACGSGSGSDPSPAVSSAASSVSAAADRAGAIDPATLPVTLNYDYLADHMSAYDLMCRCGYDLVCRSVFGES